MASQTSIITNGGCCDNPSAPPKIPPRPAATARHSPRTSPMIAIAAFKPPLRENWFRVSRHRSQSTVLSWLQFISTLQPAQFLGLVLVPADGLEEHLLQ